jgi:hypothetical protein
MSKRDFQQTQAAAIAKLRELAPDLPSPTFADAIEMLCHLRREVERGLQM